MTNINWNILAGAPDAGQAFMQGMEQGRQRRREQDTDNALRAYAANPDDPNATNALLAADPRLGLQVQGQQLERKRFQEKEQQAQLEQHRESILRGAQIIRQLQPKDEAGWQQALMIAQSQGLPLDGGIL